MRAWLAAALVVTATPAWAQNVCTPDASGRYTSTCVEAAAAQAYYDGVRAMCEQLGGTYWRSGDQHECYLPAGQRAPGMRGSLEDLVVRVQAQPNAARPSGTLLFSFRTPRARGARYALRPFTESRACSARDATHGLDCLNAARQEAYDTGLRQACAASGGSPTGRAGAMVCRFGGAAPPRREREDDDRERATPPARDDGAGRG
ncbi:MAG: hypothetical protein AAGI50_20195 [Pseudomonadota bacterium]